jgi:hypothetical protein
MKTATPIKRVIVDAAIVGSVIRGTPTASSGERRDFRWIHGELLDVGAERGSGLAVSLVDRAGGIARPWAAGLAAVVRATHRRSVLITSRITGATP